MQLHAEAAKLLGLGEDEFVLQRGPQSGGLELAAASAQTVGEAKLASECTIYAFVKTAASYCVELNSIRFVVPALTSDTILQFKQKLLALVYEQQQQKKKAAAAAAADSKDAKASSAGGPAPASASASASASGGAPGGPEVPAQGSAAPPPASPFNPEQCNIYWRKTLLKRRLMLWHVCSSVRLCPALS